MYFKQIPIVSIFVVIFRNFCEDRNIQEIYGNIIFVSINSREKKLWHNKAQTLVKRAENPPKEKKNNSKFYFS